MVCMQCQVRPDDEGGAWLTRFEERDLGPYLTCDMALRVAITDALEVRRAGGEVRIVVQDQAGETRAEICLCRRFEQCLARRAAKQ